MVQEFREAVDAAAELVNEIGSRFAVGDPAEEQVQSLAVRLADIERRAFRAGNDLPQEYREELEPLLAHLQAVVTGGECWLTQVDDTELWSQFIRERVRRVYGFGAHCD